MRALSPVVHAATLGILTLILAGCREAVPSRVEAVAGGDPRRGRVLAADYGCGGCHTIPGIPGAYGGVGPSLAGFASRTFVAGNLRNEAAFLVRWIQIPQALVPGTAMPTLGVTEADARDIAAYLYTLTPGGLGPPHLFAPSTLPGH